MWFFFSDSALQAIKQGVYDVIPLGSLANMTAEDLRLLLCGTQEVFFGSSNFVAYSRLIFWRFCRAYSILTNRMIIVEYVRYNGQRSFEFAIISFLRIDLFQLKFSFIPKNLVLFCNLVKALSRLFFRLG